MHKRNVVESYKYGKINPLVIGGSQTICLSLSRENRAGVNPLMKMSANWSIVEMKRTIIARHLTTQRRRCIYYYHPDFDRPSKNNLVRHWSRDQNKGISYVFTLLLCLYYTDQVLWPEIVLYVSFILVIEKKKKTLMKGARHEGGERVKKMKVEENLHTIFVTYNWILRNSETFIPKIS